jgi:2-hydroxychromene-2-carboxylate isomerase
MPERDTDRTVEFFYDFTSPTAFLAWTQLPKIAARTGAKLVYRPMFLGGVMQATENRPPGTVAAKGRWMQADLERWAKRYGVSFARNPHFPMLTLLTQRIAVGLQGRPEFERYLEAVFKAAWLDQKNIADKAVLAEVLAAAGLDAPALIALADDPANKEKLKANTDEAVARGAFGAPTFFVGDEMHFGQDRLDFVEEALRA